MIDALIDCARTDESQIKNLPKWGWVVAHYYFGGHKLLQSDLLLTELLDAIA